MDLQLDGASNAILQFLSGDGCFGGLGLPALSKTYTWSLPANTAAKFGELDGENISEQTTCLKHRLQKLWHDDELRRREIAEWIVSDWGGIRSNSSATFERHYANANSEPPTLKFLGVSSYSKMLSIRDVEQFAVFDARVVVALNALQLLAQTRDGLAFPYIAGRNNITGYQGKNRGFSAAKEFSVASLIKNHSWQRVPRNSAYQIYLNLVRVCATGSKLPTTLAQIEMTLFSQAESLALLAMQRTNCT